VVEKEVGEGRGKKRSQHLSPFIYTIRNRFCAFPYRIPYEMTAETNKYIHMHADIQKRGVFGGRKVAWNKGEGGSVACKVPPVCAVIMIYVKLIAYTHTHTNRSRGCVRQRWS